MPAGIQEFSTKDLILSNRMPLEEPRPRMYCDVHVAIQRESYQWLSRSPMPQEPRSGNSSPPTAAPDVFFRVAVEGGGCKGFSYNIGMDTQKLGDDAFIDIGEGVPAVAIDGVSGVLLDGAQVDWKSTLAEEKFVISNPNASSSWRLRNVVLGLRIDGRPSGSPPSRRAWVGRRASRGRSARGRDPS